MELLSRSDSFTDEILSGIINAYIKQLRKQSTI
jgi:hypothetical protein